MADLLTGKRDPAGWNVDRFLHGDIVVEVAVYPVDDLIEHELPGDGCVCGVSAELLEHSNEDDCDVWLHTHEALDGRE